jgi:yecA family protein
MTLGIAMSDFSANQPLTETDLERLGEFLRSYQGGKAMNVEEVDGFFAALIAGPEIVTPSEYMREVFYSETPETVQYSCRS